jgi:glycosyltransferase involved in cell wall biosynthesis
MKKILLVGEHPYSTTGNGNMMRAILDQLDTEKFVASVFACTRADMPAFEKLPYNIIGTSGSDDDQFGTQELLQTIAKVQFDAMLTVGIDLWRFASAWGHLNRFRRQKRFIWGAIFPYDLHMLREDWLRWVNSLDFPCVYSEYGYELLRSRAPKVRYYRPPLNGAELFRKVGDEDKSKYRQKLFHTLPNDAVLAGFIGPNQFRKDPQRMLKAFFEVKKEIPNLYLYMHTRFTKGVFNLQQIAFDYGAGVGDLIIMNQKSSYTRDAMPEIYSSLDMYINTSMQEGLSWTVLEAQLCGIPCIVSDSTAHKELVSDGAGIAVDCTELGYVPLVSERGPTWIESRCCSISGIKHAFSELATKPALRKEMGEKGIKRAREWLAGVSDVNELLEEMTQEKFEAKIPKILFVQHSSAGDVLMSTQCFKGRDMKMYH